MSYLLIGTALAVLKTETLIISCIAKGLPMKTPLYCVSVYAVAYMLLLPLLSGSSYADAQAPAVNNKQIKELNEQVKDINKNVKQIKKQSENTNDLRVIQKAEKAGLSKIIKVMSPEGGRFEIQSDGAIKIIPNDASIVKKLLEDTKESRSKNKSIEDSTSAKKSKDSKEIIERLRKANNQGLSDLLIKLGTDGGKFELIENGGIRIIPNDTTKAQELSETTSKANKLVKQKDLTHLSKSLGKAKLSINTWKKVTSLAKDWLKKNNKPNLSIGKIRHIKWLYLVSIVTQKGNMDTQLVIHASDGKTIAYTRNTFEIFN